MKLMIRGMMTDGEKITCLFQIQVRIMKACSHDEKNRVTQMKAQAQ